MLKKAQVWICHWLAKVNAITPIKVRDIDLNILNMNQKLNTKYPTLTCLWFSITLRVVWTKSPTIRNPSEHQVGTWIVLHWPSMFAWRYGEPDMDLALMMILICHLQKAWLHTPPIGNYECMIFNQRRTRGEPLHVIWLRTHNWVLFAHRP